MTRSNPFREIARAKRRTSRIVLALCAILSVSPLLAACGQSPATGDDTASNAPSSAATSQSPASQAPDAAPSSAAGDKALRIMVAKPANIENMNTNATSKYFEEKTGVAVTYEEISGEGTSEIVALTLAGGDLPDAFLNCGLNSAQLTQYGVEDQVLLPLDDLIEQYAPNLKSAMAQADVSMDLLKEVDGKTYSLPALNPCYHCSRALKMWVNDEWMQKLNLSYPTTTDEFYDMLVAFKTQDPNGNGEADEIPLTGDTDGWSTQSLNFLFFPFLYMSAYSQGFGMDGNGKIVNSLDQEAFRDALRYIHKLYAEGLIYEGTLTQKNEQMKKLVENPDAPLVGAVTAGYGGQFASSIGDERYRMYRPLAPLKGPAGVQYAQSSPQMPSQGQFVVTKDCADPAVAVQWANELYTDESLLTIFNGLEGTAWEWAKDGLKDFDGNQAKWTALIPYGGDVGKTRNDCWTQMGIYNFSAAMRSGQSIDLTTDPYSPEGMEHLLYTTTKDLYEAYADDSLAFPTLKHTADELSEVTIIRTEFNNYYTEMIFNFITGKWDLDKDWQTHLDNLKSYQVDRMLEIYQTAYDRMYTK